MLTKIAQNNFDYVVYNSCGEKKILLMLASKVCESFL